MMTDDFVQQIHAQHSIPNEKILLWNKTKTK